MKILFLTKELPYPINNGHRMRTYHYILGLIPGNDVSIITYKSNEEDVDQAISHFKDLNCDIIFSDGAPNLNICAKMWNLFCSLFSNLPYAIRLRRSKTMLEKIHHVCEQDHLDLIICDGIHQALNIPKELTCYKILDEHNVESTIVKRFLLTEKNPLKKLYASMQWKKFVAFENSQWKFFNEIHVCSDVDKKQMEERVSGLNINVVPNGVNTDKFKPQDIEINPNRIIYTGLIGWKPNEDAVLYFAKEIYPIIQKQKPNIKFYIVGKNPSTEVKNLAISDKSITVTGFVDEVIPYICESAVYVVPLRIGSGTRLKILEAMGMGKAIVSTSIGCEGIEATNQENIIIEDDPKNFAKQVIDLLNDPKKCEALGQNATNFVNEKYSWEIIQNHLNLLIERVKS